MGQLIFEPTPINDAYIVSLNPFKDERGWFGRVFCNEEFSKIGHTKQWVQINHSFTVKKGALRGMHFQRSPYTEIKLVRCIAGEIFDVIIDLRENSNTFLKWFGVHLSAQNKKMLYIPQGFAHGFQTMKENTELIYHHSEFYNSDFEDGIKYDEPLVGIKWPMKIQEISLRDMNHKYITDSFKGINI